MKINVSTCPLRNLPIYPCPSNKSILFGDKCLMLVKIWSPESTREYLELSVLLILVFLLRIKTELQVYNELS